MREPFGRLPDGREVSRYTLGTPDGVVLRVLDHGATVQSLRVPGPEGSGTEVLLGFADVAGYLKAASDCFGGVIGRYANRIAGGDLEIAGESYQLATNDGPNTLHGGPDGFHMRSWDVDEVDASTIVMSLLSPNGDQGFPGRLRVSVRYSVTTDEVRIDYTAASDAATVVNLTNHSYFNLAGESSGSAMQHELQIEADAFTVVGKGQIPTGEVTPVDETPFDFRTARTMSERLRSADPQMLVAKGYDQNLVLSGEGLRRVATLRDPASGRTLEVSTDQPGMQVYSANMLDGSHVGAGGSTYRQGDAIALETQHFPDSPHNPDFPSTVLQPGDTFTSSTVWRLSTT